MAIDILNLEPSVISRDLKGKYVLVYSQPKVGKTSFAASFPRNLLLAFEKGYNALPGVMAQDVTTWGEMKQVVRELKKPEVKERYKSLIIDTADIAADCCQKYICNQLGIENIGDGGWATNGWAKVKREWEQTFRTVTMEGYALVFISHKKDKTFKRKDGTEYNQIVPSCSTAYNEIIKNCCESGRNVLQYI